MIEMVEGIFFSIFSVIYNPLHSHFATYCLIVFLSCVFLFYNAKIIKYLHKRSQAVGTFIKFWLLFLELFVLTFLVWFVFIYFHTFRQLEPETIKPMKISQSSFFASLCLHLLPKGSSYTYTI